MKSNNSSFTRKSWLAASLVSALALGSCETNLEAPDSGSVAQSDASNAYGESGKDFVANEVLIKFKPGQSETAKNNALARISGRVSEKILTKAMEKHGDKEGLLVVHTPLAAIEALSKVKDGAEVEFAEPNYIYTHTAASTDPYFTNGSLWGLDAKNAFGSQASTAWAAGHTGSASVLVGIIDEGVQFDHPDLAGQIWTNPYDLADGIDNDGNGYVDDIHGWDFDGNNNTVYDGTTRGSSDDHGTHVAGTIGAKANNNAGVVGMNWNVTIISTKFLGKRGGTTANAVKAVDYLNDLKTRHGLNIVASNNSWGGGGFSQALSDAVSRANDRNILFIAAAGNGGTDGVGDDNDAVASFPSNLPQPNVIAVAAITSTGGKSSFSNYGATTVDIGAPGSGIWSSTAYNIYESYNGTSMATPHVTGAAALYAASHPGSSAAAIKSAILSSATPTPSLAGKCTTGGRLNVSNF